MKKIFLSMMLTIGLISFLVVPVGGANFDRYTTTEHGIGY